MTIEQIAPWMCDEVRALMERAVCRHLDDDADDGGPDNVHDNISDDLRFDTDVHPVIDAIMAVMREHVAIVDWIDGRNAVATDAETFDKIREDDPAEDPIEAFADAAIEYAIARGASAHLAKDICAHAANLTRRTDDRGTR